MTVRVNRAQAPIQSVDVLKSDDSVMFRAIARGSLWPGLFVVDLVDCNVCVAPRDELREWCVGVIEMLDQDAP